MPRSRTVGASGNAAVRQPAHEHKRRASATRFGMVSTQRPWLRLGVLS
jgi:hypothetical protein